MSSARPTPLRSPTQASFLDGGISLTDNTVPQEAPQANEDEDGDPVTPTRTKTGASSQLIGRGKLREELARRKYAKYQQGRYEESDEDTAAGPVTRTGTATTPGAEQSPATDGAGSARQGDLSTLRRGREKVRGILSRKKTRRAREGDAEIDILFENQRGWFILGMPYYSSNSLLNFDPPAWTTAEGKPSPVDISNAQVPDPNWEWSWRSWYVDMSLDVDEQGWQYSFMFQSRFTWHGNHPWFHSFVRRRRWIRQRVRKHRHLPDGRVEGGRTMHDAHKLNADYFTIHPTRTRSPDSGYPSSGDARSSIREDGKLGALDADDDDEDIDNIKALMKRLRKATVDREKITAVLKFMDQGGQDTYYLAEEMPHIMSLFIFEYSRRQLAAAMVRKVDGRPIRSDSNSGSEGDQGKETGGEPETSAQKREDDKDDVKKQNLQRAIEAADEQVKMLEYWSDIRRMVEKGETLTGTDGGQGWDETWEGLGASGPAGTVITDLDPASRRTMTKGGKDKVKGKGKARE